MSVRIILEELRRRGGQATVQELLRIHPLASIRLTRLLRQGYVDRVAPGTYRLRSMAGPRSEEGRASPSDHRTATTPESLAGNDPEPFPIELGLELGGSA